MYDYYPYRKKKKYKNTCVIPKIVLQGKTIQVRVDGELAKRIKDLTQELKQSESKVVRDILNDFFLDRILIENKKDVDHFLKNA